VSDTGLSHLFDFIYPNHIAHVTTHEDEIESKACYVIDTLRRDAQVSWVYFAPYNTR